MFKLKRCDRQLAPAAQNRLLYVILSGFVALSIIAPNPNTKTQPQILFKLGKLAVNN